MPVHVYILGFRVPTNRKYRMPGFQTLNHCNMSLRTLSAGGSRLWWHDGSQVAVLDASVLEYTARSVCRGGSNSNTCRSLQIIHFPGTNPVLSPVSSDLGFVSELCSCKAICQWIHKLATRQMLVFNRGYAKQLVSACTSQIM